MTNDDAPAKPVTERAVFRRLKRHLYSQDDGKTLHKCTPNTRWHNALGTYYAVSHRTGLVEDWDIDLVDWCREDGLLKPNEQMIEEE